MRAIFLVDSAKTINISDIQCVNLVYVLQKADFQ